MLDKRIGAPIDLNGKERQLFVAGSVPNDALSDASLPPKQQADKSNFGPKEEWDFRMNLRPDSP